MATKIAPKTVSRRGFIITTAAVSGGMVLGFHIPVHAATTSAKARNESDGGTEVKDIPMFPGISIGDAPVRH